MMSGNVRAEPEGTIKMNNRWLMADTKYGQGSLRGFIFPTES